MRSRHAPRYAAMLLDTWRVKSTMPRPRSLLIALVVVLIALWVLAPMARAMLLLRDDQHTLGSPPSIGGVQATDVHFYTSSADNPVPIAGWLVLAHPQAP